MKHGFLHSHFSTNEYDVISNLHIGCDKNEVKQVFLIYINHIDDR